MSTPEQQPGPEDGTKPQAVTTDTAPDEGATREAPAASPASGERKSASKAQHVVSSLVARPLFWVVFIALVLVIPLRRSLGVDVAKPPEMKLALPAFELTNERGERFGSENLKGQVWVADFVFTSCPTVCPRLTKRMFEIQHRARHLGDAFHLVTFTVDPENDTPERLNQYARDHHAVAARWTFLTGSLAEIEATVIKGFKLAMGKEPVSPGASLFTIFHGERLVLVDREGFIRGYYEADDAGIANLLRDAGTLANLPYPGP